MRLPGPDHLDDREARSPHVERMALEELAYPLFPPRIDARDLEQGDHVPRSDEVDDRPIGEGRDDEPRDGAERRLVIERRDEDAARLGEQPLVRLALSEFGLDASPQARLALQRAVDAGDLAPPTDRHGQVRRE